jgi:hypothetical protein
VLDGELKHGVWPFYEDYDGAMTHIGGMPLFWELDVGFADEWFVERPSNDIAYGAISLLSKCSLMFVASHCSTSWIWVPTEKLRKVLIKLKILKN